MCSYVTLANRSPKNTLITSPVHGAYLSSRQYSHGEVDTTVSYLFLGYISTLTSCQEIFLSMPRLTTEGCILTTVEALNSP